jgi:diketogulonate reductase-like aldo/keto reductase
MMVKGVARALMLSSGHSMPAVGLGMWWMEKPTINNLIHSVLRIGYCHLDCTG